MTKPVRLQLSRKRGFSLQELSLATNGLPAVNVARPGKFGNPFRIGDLFKIEEQCNPDFADIVTCEATTDETYSTIVNAETAVMLFERLNAQVNIDNLVDELRGHNVACWCGLDQACHGDVWLRLCQEAS